MVQFAEYLEDHKHAPWADKYLPYNQLKDAIKDVTAAQKRVEEIDPQSGGGGANMSEQALQFLQDKERDNVHELVKKIRATLDEYRDIINDHYVSVKKQIMHEKAELAKTLQERQKKGAAKAEQNVQSLEAGAGPGQHRPTSPTVNSKVARQSAVKQIASHKAVSEKLNDLFQLESHLVEFATVNYMGFYKFLKKFQKQTKLYVLASYIVTVENCFFVTNLLRDASASGGNFGVDGPERERLSKNFARRATSVAALCEEALVILLPSMAAADLHRTHVSLQHTEDRLLATLEVCSSSEYRDTLQRVKMRLFAQILQVMEFQFLNVSSEGAEAMRILQRIQGDLFAGDTQGMDRLQNRSQTLLQKFGERARQSKLRAATRLRLATRKVLNKIRSERDALNPADGETTLEKSGSLAETVSSMVSFRQNSWKAEAGDDRDRSDSADDRAYLHAKQIRKREEAEVEAERGRVADESLPVRETADAEEPIVLQAAGLDGNETLFQWAFEDDAFEQRIEGTADIFSDEFRAEQRARTRGQICSGVVELLMDMKPAVTEWICQYDCKQYLARDILCGIIISVILLPQGLSYASLADVEPTVGIYAGIFPALVYSVWGVSAQGAVGPMSIPALMSGAAIDSFIADKYPGDSDALQDLELRTKALAVISLCVGVIVTLIGLLRLGFLLDFVSVPVLKGFTAAACTITILAVFKDILGIHVEKSQLLHIVITNMHDAVQAYGVSVNAIITGAASLLFLFTCKFLTKVHVFKCRRKSTQTKRANVQPVKTKQSRVSQKPPSPEQGNADTALKTPAGPATVPQATDEEHHNSRCGCSLKEFESGFAKFPAPLLLIFVACIVFFVLCPNEPPPDIDVASLNAWGASIPSLPYEAAAAQYTCFANNTKTMQAAALTPVNMSYTATGSGAGKTALVTGSALHWIGTDSYFSAADLAAMDAQQRSIMAFPSMGVAVAPIVNFGTNEQLVLTPEVLASIMVGNITSWSDPSILELNAIMYNTLTTAGDISTVVRQDASGTTTIFCVGMARLVPAFADAVICANDEMRFRNDGSRVGDFALELGDGLLNKVMTTHGAIGYVSFSDVRRESSVNAQAVVLRNSVTKRLAHCSATSISIQSKLHPWTERGQGFSSAEVNSTSLLQVVGYWLEDPISQEVGWPFSSFTLAALDKVNLATQADSVDAQQKFDCQTRAHDFIFWEWFFNASQIAEVYDEDHAVNETLLSTTLSDMGFAHVAAEVARALAAEMASTCYCFNSSSSSWISAGDVLLDREEVLPAADTDLCAPASYTLCTDVELLGEISPFALDPKIDFTFDDFLFMLPQAAVIAIIALLEHSAVVKILSVQDKVQVRLSRDFFAVGFANIVGGLFGSLPAMCGFSRSAINYASGARSQISLFVSVIAAVIFMLTITPALYYLPKAVLGAIIVQAMTKLYDFGIVVFLWKANKMDFLIWVVAFVLTLFMGMQVGIIVAIVLSVVSLLFRMSRMPMEQLMRRKGTNFYQTLPRLPEKADFKGVCGSSTDQNGDDEKPATDDGSAPSDTFDSASELFIDIPEVTIIKIPLALYFGNVAVFKAHCERLVMDSVTSQARGESAWKAMILDMSAVRSVDGSGLQGLMSVIYTVQSNDRYISIAGAAQSLQARLVELGGLANTDAINAARSEAAADAMAEYKSTPAKVQAAVKKARAKMISRAHLFTNVEEAVKAFFYRMMFPSSVPTTVVKDAQDVKNSEESGSGRTDTDAAKADTEDSVSVVVEEYNESEEDGERDVGP